MAAYGEVTSFRTLIILGCGVRIAWSVCNDCWSVGTGAGYKLLPTIGTRDHTVGALDHCGLLIMLLGGIAYVLFLRFSGAHKDSVQHFRLFFMLSALYSLSIVVVALGITAAALIPSLSENTQLINSTAILVIRVSGEFR